MRSKQQPQVCEQPRPEPRLLDMRGAAAYLSATVWCMRSLVWNKQIKSIKLGKKILFDRADLDKFVDGMKDAA
jgi:excisionase family DNA binding protein